MSCAFRIIFVVASTCLLSACGGNENDHGHPHDDTGSAPPAAESSAGDEMQHGHPHGEDTHSHDGPETEAYYGEEATNPTENAVVDDDAHAHGDLTHTHSGAEEGPDSTPEHGEDKDSDEPHGYDH
jgi:hypothetical protein